MQAQTNFAEVVDDNLQARRDRILRFPNVPDRAQKHSITMSRGCHTWTLKCKNPHVRTYVRTHASARSADDLAP